MACVFLANSSKIVFRAATLLWFGQIAVGCLYDPDNRCGPGQQLIEYNRCVCNPNHVLDGRGCVPCPENSTEQGGKCVCNVGFTQAAESGECIQTARGNACDTVSAPCSVEPFSYCRVVSGTQGYCTSSGCTSSADCSDGYACDTTASPSFCKRPPTGRNQPCASDADCAGYEASWCEPIQSHTCQVRDCSVDDPKSCFEDSACCDLSSFGLPRICVPHGTCPL
jgi:hypothetical protein